MILNQESYAVESGGLLAEKFFGVKDLGMIFDILRSKLYSNPILAVCREISCNARDAMREANNFDDPITIHLPSGLEPEYKVKDTGVGISPDRVENIFINYTASTKREDNIQTGSFGLGSKSPFAVCDSFTVLTIYNGIKYTYACFIDETKVGKLALMNEEKTDEPNGTEISIPVKRNDFYTFQQYTEQACRHWDVKPIITNGTINWEPVFKIMEGKNWAISSNTYDYRRKALLVIDGIEYPLDLEALRKYADAKLIDSARGDLIMYFGIGELSLSANREQIYLDKPTQTKIEQRLKEIQDEIKTVAEAKIDAFPTLWDANVYYRKELSHAFSGLDFLGQLAWKGNILNKGQVKTKCPIYFFQKGKSTSHYRRGKAADPNKLYRTISRTLQFYEDCELFVNDLGIKDPTSKHIKKAFDDNPNLKYAQIICPDDKQTEDDLDKAILLKELTTKRLSSITVAPKHPRAYTPVGSRLLVFKFETTGGCVFRQVSYDAMEQDTNEKVLCLLERQQHYSQVERKVILDTHKNLPNNFLKSLSLRNPSISFYGVDKDTDAARIKKEFSDFRTLDAFIEEEIINNKKINYIEMRFAHLHGGSDIDSNMLSYSDKIVPMIDDKQSLYLTRLNLHKKIAKLYDEDCGLMNMYETVKGQPTNAALNSFVKSNPDWDIVQINKEFIKKYPMLQYISSYYYDVNAKHIADYVNMVDRI